MPVERKIKNTHSAFILHEKQNTNAIETIIVFTSIVYLSAILDNVGVDPSIPHANYSFID